LIEPDNGQFSVAVVQRSLHDSEASTAGEDPSHPEESAVERDGTRPLQRRDRGDPAAILVAVGKMMQQIPRVVKTGLLEHAGPLRPDTVQRRELAERSHFAGSTI